MSEEAKKSSTTGLKLEVIEHEPFVEDGSVKILTGNEFILNYVEPIFSNTFSDYYGAKFELTNNNALMLSIYFDRYDHGADECVATTRTPNNGADGIKNKVILETRQFSIRNKYSDRYFLTDDGMSFFDDLFMPNAINKRNGKVNYGNCITTISMNNNFGYVANGGFQLTKVSFVDPTRIASELFGRKDDNGNNYIYKVGVSNVIGNPYDRNTDFLIMITRLNMTAYSQLCNKLGINNNSGIVRSK